MADSLPFSLPRIGFIGLGGMGSRMTQRLLDAGSHVTVYNRTRRRTEDLGRSGASVADSARALAASADIVLSSVADDTALAQVMYGGDGALAGATPGSVLIDLSTVHPRASIRLSEAGRTSGVDVLDTPVSGSLPQAEQGQLVLFAEALALGERAGLTRGHLLEALAETSVLSPSQRSKFDNIRRDEYPPTFPLRLMAKDFSLILQRARELGVPVPATAAAAQVAATEHAREASAHVDDDLLVVVRTMRLAAPPAPVR
jgi:3-hydroxyisobutyrate dehydrogenase-like beta-hydroxyacid dehydrogenase